MARPLEKLGLREFPETNRVVKTEAGAHPAGQVTCAPVGLRAAPLLSVCLTDVETICGGFSPRLQDRLFTGNKEMEFRLREDWEKPLERRWCHKPYRLQVPGVHAPSALLEHTKHTEKGPTPIP